MRVTSKLLWVPLDLEYWVGSLEPGHHKAGFTYPDFAHSLCLANDPNNPTSTMGFP
jgi:hypothetical protein